MPICPLDGPMQNDAGSEVNILGVARVSLEHEQLVAAEDEQTGTVTGAVR
jgi:hypothetical protein